ncbi:MAG TPA: serine hydrolase domain-containing protein [Rhizomicrobium sp.]|nr:serine hydrolase domain-containing protein [Rhizomicrobium sp.]
MSRTTSDKDGYLAILGPDCAAKWLAARGGRTYLAWVIGLGDGGMRLLITVAAWAAFSVPVLAAGADSAAVQAAIDAALKSSKVPGMGAVVIGDGHIAGIAVGGVRRMGKPDPVTTGDPWLIASNTKPMTATMILRLVEQKRLSLDAPLSATWPALAAAARPEYRAITLRQMLSHTAGLPHDYHDIAKVMDSFFGNSTPLPAQRFAYLKLALTDAPVSPPGKENHYSNTGFILAAAIAEHATGLSYEALMQREIFAPLDMRDARVALPPPDGNHGHMDGKPAAVTDEIPAAMNPAGGVSLSLSAWAAFCIDQLDGAKGHGRLLNAADYKLMQSPQPGSDGGLDWGYDKNFFAWQGPVLEHGGSDEAWRSIVLLFPDTGNALLVTANADKNMGGDDADRSVLKALLPLVAHHVAETAPK